MMSELQDLLVVRRHGCLEYEGYRGYENVTVIDEVIKSFECTDILTFRTYSE